MDKVDLFFKYLTELNRVNKKINKDFVFTPEMIYNELIYFNTQKEDIRHLFNRWIDRFSSRPGIKVFKVNNFCLFVSGNVDKNNSFKMYISLSKNIDENVTKIFEYLRSNNINHISTVTPYTRNDTLTIRVNTLDDVKLIKEFLDEENIIYNPMPFTLEFGVVRDSLYAYAFEICKVISESEESVVVRCIYPACRFLYFIIEKFKKFHLHHLYGQYIIMYVIFQSVS